ncbi:MAG: LysR family transcriptional regulator [Sphingomonadaceae bacterium]|nr:LysR family transcriptional regulator [Sphingomonadaceae bacterium]
MEIWAFNLRHLRAALETARLGSITAAALAVNLTQPAITQALANLEVQLGLPLFERRHDGMEPLDAMQLLVPRIQAALAHVGSSRVTMAQMRALIALGEEGSYPLASKATGLAQPSLHRAVSDLAVALRRTLVERRGKGIGLTESGRRTLRGFRLARAELAAAISEIEGLKGHETGRLAIGAMPLSRARVLPAAITAFHHAHPDIRINILEGSWLELVEPLRDGEIDLMIGALREPMPDLVQRPLFEDRPVVFGRRGHPASGVNPRPEILATYSWTVPPIGTPLRGQWHAMFEQAGVTPPSVPIECGSVMMIRQILIDSDFLTLLSPDQVAVELEAGWLEAICNAPPGIVRTIGITTRAGWRPTAKQQAFLNQLLVSVNN